LQKYEGVRLLTVPLELERDNGSKRKAAQYPERIPERLSE